MVMHDSIHRTNIYGSASFIKNMLLKREKPVLSLRLRVLNSDSVIVLMPAHVQAAFITDGENEMLNQHSDQLTCNLKQKRKILLIKDKGSCMKP